MVKLLKAINDKNPRDVWNQLLSYNSHPELHINKSIEEMADRALYENKKMISTFSSEKQAICATMDAIMLNAKEIETFLEYGDHGDRINISSELYDGFEEDYGVPRTFEGVAFEDSLKIKETTKIHVTLELDKNLPYEIKIITCYPDFDLNNENVKTLDQKVDVTKMEHYRMARSEQDRTYLKCLSEFNCSYKLNDSVVVEDIKKNGDIQRLFLKENDTKFRIYKFSREEDNPNIIRAKTILDTNKYCLNIDQNIDDKIILRKNFINMYNAYNRFQNNFEIPLTNSKNLELSRNLDV